MHRRASIATAFALVLVWGSACTASQVSTPEPFPTLPLTPAESETSAFPLLTPTPTSTGPEVEVPVTPTIVTSDFAVQAAVTALSEQLGVPESSITLVDTPLPVQWTDSSLGCPEEGQVYIEIITPGYLITLAVASVTYEVHTDLSGTAVVCDSKGQGLVPDPIVAEFIVQARSDLANRLGVPPDEIVLVRSEAVEWSNASLGCEVEGQEYEEAITVGYRIVLAVGEDYYEYHTDQQRMILCPNPTE